MHQKDRVAWLGLFYILIARLLGSSVPFRDYKRKSTTRGGVKAYTKLIQGYAARGEFLLFVPRVYKLDVQGYAARGGLLPFVPL